MKKTILGASRKDFCSKLNKHKIMAVALGIVTVMITTVLVGMRNDQNHFAVLCLTIAADVAYGWYIIAVLDLSILPMQRLLKLFDATNSSFSGRVVEVSEHTLKMQRIDCYKIVLENEGERIFFLPDTLTLSEGDEISHKAAGTIITEVEYE